jgi:hypothetical protein
MPIIRLPTEDFQTTFANGETPPPPLTVPEPAVVLCYPLSVESDVKSPFIRFNQIGSQKTIVLPLPNGGIPVNDGASYGTVDLGLIGPAYKTITGSDGEAPDYKKQQDMNESALSNLAPVIATLVKKSGPENISNAIKLGAGKILAPNTHVIFQNNSVRQFSFLFKMVAYEKKESDIIKEIIDTFRLSIYAELGEIGVVVKFPKPWKIQFYRENGILNEYLPYIKQSYLTSLSAVYNATSNLYHYDGAPIEVDVTLQFQETKVLHKEDLRLPYEEGYKYARGNREE